MAEQRPGRPGSHTPLTPQEKQEMLRRRNARLAAQQSAGAKQGQSSPAPRQAAPRTGEPTKQQRRQQQARQQQLAEQRRAREQDRQQARQEQKKQQKEQEKREKLRQKQEKKRQKLQQKQQRQAEKQAAAPRPGSRTAARRARRRRAIFTVVALLLFVVVGAVLSVTVLFKINTYQVEGDCIYSTEQLVAAFGHSEGENMFRFRLADAGQQMQAQLPYLESVKVRRRLPDTVVFLVTPATECAALMQEDGSAVLLSESLRVLATGAAPGELLQVTGYTPSALTVGSTVTSGNDNTDQLLSTFLGAIRASGLEGITAIDLSDQYELTALYAGRITVRLGTGSQLEYKLSVVKKALQAGAADGSFTDASVGTLDASNAGSVYYRP